MGSKSLSWARPLYFIYYAASAALNPFLVIFYQELGLSGSQIGILAGLPSLVSLVSGPIWGTIIDRTNKKKLPLQVAIIGSILVALSISLIKSFVLLIPVVTVYAFFFSTVGPLMDTTTMAELGGEKKKYGQYRMWGAIGWGMMAPIIGALIERFSIQSTFWAYAVLMLVGFFIASGMQVRGQLTSNGSFAFRQFLADKRWLLFLAAMFIFGMILSMVSNYLFIFLRSMGADEMTLGWMLTMATLSEIPVLYFSNHLLKRWRPIQLMPVAMLFFALRAFLLTLISHPSTALWIQLLHGPTFSLMWTSGVAYADEIAPAGLNGTAQGLFSGVMMGVGSGVGAILGGVIYDTAGLIPLFSLASALGLVTGVLMLALEGRKHAETIRYSGRG
jgi:MFS family permease